MLYLRSGVSFSVALVVALVGFLPLSAVAQPVSRPFLLPVPPNAEYLGYADVSRLEGQPFLADLVAPFSGDLYFFERPGASAITAVAFYGSFERFPDWSLLLAQGDFDLSDGPGPLEPFRYVGFDVFVGFSD